MIKKLLFSSIALFVFSCATKKIETTEYQSMGSVTELEAENNLEKCFTAPDSTFKQKVKVCSTGYYKLINDQLVLRIAAGIEVLNNECIDLDINISDQNLIAQLLIFEKGKAQLDAICTEMISAPNQQPFTTLDQSIGRITFGKSVSIENYEPQFSEVTIMVHQLIFLDMETREEILINKELFWKVPDPGITVGN